MWVKNEKEVDISGVQYYYMFMNHEHAKKMNTGGGFGIIESGINRYLPDARIINDAPPGLKSEYDYTFKLTPSSGKSVHVVAEFKKNLRPTILPLIHARFAGAASAYKMLVSDYISPAIADKLKEQKTWFADETGNIYIDIPGRIFIFNVGNKRKAVAKVTPLVSAANARVFFFLLKSGAKVTGSYRHLANEAVVSLGKMSQAIKELQRRRIIVIQKSGLEILQPLKLLELWVQSYTEKLKPQMHKGTYTWKHGNDFSQLETPGNYPGGATWIGGERAAELMTDYLKPDSMDLWTQEENIHQLSKSYKLMESARGHIRIYTVFSETMSGGDAEGKDFMLQLVHPLIVYADLLGIPDARCHETAQMLKDKYLGWIQ